jgi:hypothetical protein
VGGTFFDFTPVEEAESKTDTLENGSTKPFGDNFRDDLRCLAEEVGVNWRKSLGKG